MSHIGSNLRLSYLHTLGCLHTDKSQQSFDLLASLNQILEAAGDQVEQQHGGLYHVNKSGLYKFILLLCNV